MKKSNKKTEDYDQIDELINRAEQDAEEVTLSEEPNEELDDKEPEKQDSEPKKRKPRRIKLFTNTQICIIGLIIFVLMMFFAENNNFMYKRALSERLEVRIRERDSLLDKVHRDSVIIEKLKNEDSFLEKYARENFYYRAEDEDVFIVEPDSSDVN